MIVSHNFGIGLQEYAQKDIDNDFPKWDRCPGCQCLAHGNLYGNGYYYRYGKTADMDEPELLLIKRMRCKNCKCSFSVLPSFLIPYFQMASEAVVSLVSDCLNSKEHPAPRQTKWFYRKRFDKCLNWVYLFLTESVQRFSAPRDPLNLARICLKMIMEMGCEYFVLSSFGYLNTYFFSH